MTQQAMPGQPAAPVIVQPNLPAPTEPVIPFEERLDAIKTDKAPESAAAETAAPAEDELSKAREDRAARIAALQANERKRVDSRRQAKPPREVVPPSVAQRLAELEANKAPETIEELFTHAQRKQFTPEQMAMHLRDQLTNPAKLAEQEARKLVTASEMKQQAEISALREQLGRMEAERQSAYEAQQNAEAAHELIQVTSGNARLAPNSAQFLSSKGAPAYIAFATEVANSLPPGIGIPALHDAIENSLEAFLSGMSRSPLPSTKPVPPQRAAAKANTTVSNALASQRSAIADPDLDFAKLTFDERLALIKQQ